MPYLHFLDASGFLSASSLFLYFSLKIVPTILLLLLLCKIFFSLFTKKINPVNIKLLGILWFWVVSCFLLSFAGAYSRFYTYKVDILSISLVFFYVISFSSLTFSILLLSLENNNEVMIIENESYLVRLKNLSLSTKYILWGVLSSFVFFRLFSIEYLVIDKTLDPIFYNNPFACMNCPLSSYEKSFIFVSFNSVIVYCLIFTVLNFLKKKNYNKSFKSLYSLFLLATIPFIFRTFDGVGIPV